MQNGFLDELVGLFELTGTPRHVGGHVRRSGAPRPAEVTRELGRVEALLQGMEETAVESFGVPGSLIFGEAKELAAQARYFCEQQAR